MTVRIGIGGWTFEPWRGVFYPDGLPHARELEHAGRHLKTIEINGTFYRTPSAKSCADWARQVPDGFVFALKATRYVTNRRVLAEAGESIGKFIASGIVEMGDRLGPINWQFAATKAFDPDDFGAFLALLPEQHEGVRLRHAVEVRHPSFVTAEFVALARRHSVAIVFADHAAYPAIADLTADFTYARLQQAREDVETGYDGGELDRWATAARDWAGGRVPEGLTIAEARGAGHDVGTPAGKIAKGKTKAGAEPGAEDKPVAEAKTGAQAGAKAPKTVRPAPASREVFIYLINGAKVRAPAGAMALQARIDAG
ncbi:DUF72 domain-containing protein [Xanthobacter sp. V3C-3]|uniref:DUF72 domain-containing protein n=1 Tax=Xanthobacter lutulentifluminis TaxID=3119935 RepID=UPI00372860B9